ncbi:hypothetical protein C8Q76DRAFT_696673 [Earliella scabrosa]|nr:hypothetical protein C8Q76DRAFT_696673 [Earliella scabrosa]
MARFAQSPPADKDDEEASFASNRQTGTSQPRASGRLQPSHDLDDSESDPDPSYHPSDNDNAAAETPSEEDYALQPTRARVTKAPSSQARQSPANNTKAPREGVNSKKGGSTGKEVGSQQKALTPAQKKAKRVQAVRDQIAGMRVERDPSPPTGSKRRAPSAVTPANKKRKEDAFTADFRRRQRDAATGTPQRPPRTAATRQASPELGLVFLDDVITGPSEDFLDTSFGLDDFTYIDDARSPIIPHASSSKAPPRYVIPEEEIQGINDDDIDISRNAVLARSRAQSRTTKNPMIGIASSVVIDGDEAAGPSRPPRASRAPVPDELSRAFNALPKWIQPTILSVIVPSLIKYYGSRDDPWDLDGTSTDVFKSVLNRVLLKVHPDYPHQVDRGEKIWRFARQGVYNWRSAFGRLAIQIVRTAAKKVGNPEMIAIWAQNALAKGGESTYSEPNTVVPESARGSMRSKYIVQLLAFHLEECEGSILGTGYPVGAVSLAAVAIRRAFGSYKTGSYKAPTVKFSEENYAIATQKARRGAVAGLLLKPSRMEGLVADATEYMPTFKAAQAQLAQGDEDDDDAYGAVDPNTSPAPEVSDEVTITLILETTVTVLDMDAWCEPLASRGSRRFLIVTLGFRMASYDYLITNYGNPNLQRAPYWCVPTRKAHPILM